MNTRDKLLMIELFVTGGMVLCAVWLFPKEVISFRLEATLLVALGLCFSVFRMSRVNSWPHITAPAAIAAVCAWMIYIVFSASLAYRELVVLALQGLIFMEIALSFTMCAPAFMGYVQALSMPLFMAQALFNREYGFGALMLIACYLMLAGLAMRFKLFVHGQSGKGSVFFHGFSYILPAAAIVASIASGGFFFASVPLPRISGPGTLFGSSEKAHDLEKDYYDKQEHLQKHGMDLILDLTSSDRRIESFEDLNNLVKESPLTIDADQGEEGLISLLKTPGAGLDPVELEKRKHLTSSYCDVKARFEQHRAQTALAQSLRADPLIVPARMQVMNHVSRIRDARSLEDIRKLPAPQDKVKRLTMGKRQESAIQEQLERLQEWKMYEIYRGILADVSARERSMHGEASQRLREIIEGIKGAGTLADAAVVREQIRASRLAGDFSGSDMYDALQEALDIKTHMIQAAQARRAREAVLDDPDISAHDKDRMLQRIDAAANINVLTDESSRSRSAQPSPSIIPYQPGIDLEILSLTPDPAELTVGLGDDTIMPVVIGICKDGSRWDFTDVVFWRSSDTGVADIIAGRLSARAVGEARLYAVYRSIESSLLRVTVEGPKLISLIASVSRDRGDLRDVFAFTAAGVWSDGAREDLTAKVLWDITEGRAVRIDKNTAYPRRFGSATVRAVYNGMTSQPVRIEVAASARWILGIAVNTGISVLLLILLAVSILTALAERRRQSLLGKRSDPRQYLIAVYDMVRRILYLAGMKGHENAPYRHFARHAHAQTTVSEKLLLKMTDAYEEARFSTHDIPESIVLEAAGQYNQIVQSLLAQGPSARKIRLISSILMNRLPLSL